ncbi:MAG: glycosyltransferase [Clostridiales Family XIII bacterium]|jgi:glycosyltransferase involved in cell wall biosynthesis|nr:glycosyltransferase [Clostridiales Family XIII bacterium]
MPKVSIIIPVWNTEPYLRRCLDSVVNQTLKDLEIICVNDASPDSSAEILQEYAQKDSRIKIVTHNKNQGLSAARNTGVDVCTGEYVYFIDSDDWIDLDYLERMVRVIDDKKLDVVANNSVFEVVEDVFKKIPNSWLREKSFPMVCTYLFRKTFLNKFKPEIFPVGLKHEDVYFYYTAIKTLNSLEVINGHVYYYYHRSNGSITTELLAGKISYYDIITVVERIYQYYLTNNLLDTYSVPILVIECFLMRSTDKDEFILRINLFLKKISKDIFDRYYLYTDHELGFMNDILESKNYLTYQALLKKRMFSKLKKFVLDKAV